MEEAIRVTKGKRQQSDRRHVRNATNCRLSQGNLTVTVGTLYRPHEKQKRDGRDKRDNKNSKLMQHNSVDSYNQVMLLTIN